MIADVKPRLEVCGISKSYPGVQALRDVSLEVFPGEVLAVIGENGAGKSTLMKILAGIQGPDAGDIKLDGASVRFHSPRAAMLSGIALIHQELNLADNLDVAANIFLGRERHRMGWINRPAMGEQSRIALRKVGLDIPPSTPLSQLTIGQQQLVEIAKAISSNAKILIMDEPTSSLSAHETERLIDLIRELRSQGISIIYISHRLNEVVALADRVVALRDGQYVGTLLKPEIHREAMVRMMVGRELSQFFAHKSHTGSDVRFEVRNCSTALWPGKSVSFSLRRGEIVGMAGLVGAGRTELLRAIFGIDPMLGGQVLVDGKPCSIRSPAEALKFGIGLVPEDRKQQGLLVAATVRENMMLASLRTHSRTFGIVDAKQEKNKTESMVGSLRVKTPSIKQIAKNLSGGNQQKIVIGKWLLTAPKVLLLDEPTRGIDVGAKHEIYQLMDELAAQGLSILFVSSELEEIIGMSDRVLVIHEGNLAGTIQREELSEESIMSLATGQRI